MIIKKGEVMKMVPKNIHTLDIACQTHTLQLSMGDRNFQIKLKIPTLII